MSSIPSLFCCCDDEKLVVQFNGFQKKSQKTSKKEIDKALMIKQEYLGLFRE